MRVYELQGDEDNDAKRSRPSIGKPVSGSCEERTREFVWDRSADHIRASGQTAALSKAEYMTAPERFADSQIPLAPRAPSIHDPSETCATIMRLWQRRLWRAMIARYP